MRIRSVDKKVCLRCIFLYCWLVIGLLNYSEGFWDSYLIELEVKSLKIQIFWHFGRGGNQGQNAFWANSLKTGFIIGFLNIVRDFCCIVSYNTSSKAAACIPWKILMYVDECCVTPQYGVSFPRALENTRMELLEEHYYKRLKTFWLQFSRKNKRKGRTD